MFFASALIATLAGTAAFATPLKRAGALNVNVVAPAASVASVDELKLVAEVTNTGSEDVKVFKYGTILDSSPTKSFEVTKDGEAVAFQGIRMSFSFDDATDDDYVFIAAGETASVEHDLTALYNFETAGTGSFNFAPVMNFQVASASSLVKSTQDMSAVEVTSNTVDVVVSDDVAKRDPEAGHETKRGVVSCSNASQNSFISASYSEAKELSRLASSWIGSNSGSSLYSAYWKTNSASSVRRVFDGVSNESGSRTYSCTDPYGVCTGGVIAYTVIATTNIYYCSIFYNEVANSRLCSGTTVASRNIRGGTTLHEITHAVSGTTDVTYGCSADQGLSASNQLRNADNYNCFATQVYQNTRC